MTTYLVKGSKYIQIQTVLLFLSFCLCMASTLSCPISSRWSLKISTSRGILLFGPLGWWNPSLGTYATGLPYDITKLLREATAYNGFKDGYGDTTRLALIPVTAALSLMGSIISVLAPWYPVEEIALAMGSITFIVGLAGLCCEYTLFAGIRAVLVDNTPSKVSYGSAHWCILLAVVLLAFCPVVAGIDWWFARRRKRDTGIYQPLKKRTGYSEIAF